MNILFRKKYKRTNDYKNTKFGGWIWGKDDPVHGKEYKRFAKLVDGREEKPG